MGSLPAYSSQILRVDLASSGSARHWCSKKSCAVRTILSADLVAATIAVLECLEEYCAFHEDAGHAVVHHRAFDLAQIRGGPNPGFGPAMDLGHPWLIEVRGLANRSEGLANRMMGWALSLIHI